MRIGIVGGTFNPVHLGHLMLGEYAHEEFELDEVWFLPNGNPPHKDELSIRKLTEDRIRMLELAIEDVPYFRVESYEIEQNKISYSFETMENLCARYPDYEFYFIIGTDSLFQLDNWRNPAILLNYCNLLVACRDFIDIEEIEKQINYINKKYCTDVKLLRMPILEVSSSGIRNRILQHLSVKYVVPTLVEQYIKNHHLYSKDN